MSSPGVIKLKVPHQDLDQCSLFAIDKQSVDAWVKTLPTANLGQTSRHLYEALLEVNRVRMLPEKRMMILEQIRPAINYVSRALSKHYLNQHVILPEQPRKVANLAYTLHQHQATGYTIVATHTAALGKQSHASSPEALIEQSMHRAITDHTINIQRHFQLYENVDDGVWHHLHQFYLLAHQHQLLDHFIEDSELGSCTLADAYIRALLIGCAKPNQLRQEDFNHLFHSLTTWAKLCHIENKSPESLFVIDTDGDSPPVYHGLYESVAGEHWLSLNTKALVNHLTQLRDSPTEENDKSTTSSISKDLLGHLILSWGSMSKRMFMRLESDDSLDLAVGLSTAHHYVSGELSFDSLIEERGAKTFSIQENPFMKAQSQVARGKDVWDSPYQNNLGDTNVSMESIDFHIQDNEKNNKTPKTKYNQHTVKIVNSSAHGYCLQWPIDIDANIKTGEVIGIKEAKSKNWSIGVIRWVSQQQEHTQLGIELISPNASPYGARIIHKTGGQGDFMRILILPEMPLINRPVTLLTPRVPFKTGQKVVLNQRGREVQVLLNKKLNDVGNYNLFEFRKVSSTHTRQTNRASKSDDEFDSLWDNL